MKTTYKTPMRLKGFQDFFAEDMQIRNFVITTFKNVYEKYGYEPLETPALEYAELVLGQSGAEAEKQYYRFTDAGGRDVMLRFEVMIAMCRAVAQNINNISLPYKRYQIQPVWRAENTQKGRYREFTQCDADTIGSKSMIPDAEFIQMGLEAVGILGFENYVARISNKKFLESIAEYYGIPQEQWYGFQISIDKLEKIGIQAVLEELTKERDVAEDLANKALELIDPIQYTNLSFGERIEAFRKSVGTIARGKEALDELTEILEYLEAAEVNSKLYEFDVTIARGLASYTGPVWEFAVRDGGVGSIGGAGRYDKAISKYVGYDVPATGGSFGIERICDILKDRKMTNFGDTTTEILIVNFGKSTLKSVLQLANKLRAGDKTVMVYPEEEKIGKQFAYADKKKIPSVIILGEDEQSSGTYRMRDMISGEETIQKL